MIIKMFEKTEELTDISTEELVLMYLKAETVQSFIREIEYVMESWDGKLSPYDKEEIRTHLTRYSFDL